MGIKAITADLISAMKRSKQNRLAIKDFSKMSLDCSYSFWVSENGIAKWEIKVTRIND